MARLRHVAIRCDDLDWGAPSSTRRSSGSTRRSGDGNPGGAVYLSDGIVNLALIKVSPDFPNAKPDGLNHIGFVVEDIDEAVTRAERLGATSLMGNFAREEDAAAGATWEVKMKAPDGVAFEISDHGWPGTSQLYSGAASS